MNEHRILEGKNVDEAIEKACSLFGLDRDQLNIEILEGGSSGIFGLVGVKKARIRAGRKNIPQEQEKPKKPPKQARLDVGVAKPSEDTNLEDMIRTVLQSLLVGFADKAQIEIDTGGSPIKVNIADPENSGLIIGRDGQTISALQYMTNRIVSKHFPESSRIQLDAGDYRERQDDSLAKTSIYLAQKARESGRVQSTKPLSSYHRRIVHVALHDQDDIVTRSKGEGSQKRVLIMPRKMLRRSQDSSEEIQAETDE
ncbi:MAG: KH domain-containing protein [Deltaproteobacteria bacterium]|nr:KH domain-containing protein [Deltaproteobacteria bacterium]